MLTYSDYLQLLGGRLDFVGWLVLLTGLGLVFHVLCGGWAAPWLLGRGLLNQGFPRRGSEDEPDSGIPLGKILTELLAVGIATNILLWTISLYVFKSAAAGTVAALMLGALGMPWLRSSPWRSLRFDGWPWWIMTAAAVILGLWHHALVEFPISVQGVPHFLYNDLWGDLPVHMHVTHLLGQGGLPLLSLYGASDPGLPYCPPSHIGYGVWTWGVSTITGASPYQAVSGLWILCRILICWSGYAILSRTVQRPARNAILAFIPLVLGGIGWPMWNIGPDTDKQLMTTEVLAGVLYWNFPQAVSVALTFAALVLLDDAFRDRRLTSRLYLATLVLVVGGLCKPSLFIFVGPALWIVLLIRRVSWTALAGIAVLSAAGVAVYLLPSLFPHENLSRGWSLHPTWQQSRTVAELFLWKGAGLFLLALPRIVDLLRHPWKRPEQNLVDVPLIAMGGALLFPILFREEDLVPFGMQPNLFWGAVGCLQLLWPFLAGCQESAGLGRGWRWTNRLAWCVLAVQIATGSLFAIRYPLLATRMVPKGMIDVVTASRQFLRPTDRSLLDPLLSDTTAASYLGCPQAMDYAFNVTDQPLLAQWVKLWNGDVSGPPFPWDRFEAVIVQGNRIPIAIMLEQRDWSQRKLPYDFVLWRSPRASERPAQKKTTHGQ